MDLEKKLTSEFPELCSSLTNIKNFSIKVWKTPLLPWFTNHNVSHSEEVIHLLGQILSPIEDTKKWLNGHELFILLASSYLHDIGMQFLKMDGISVEKLTPDNYDQIRKRHAEISHDIILKRFNVKLDRDDFYVPILKDGYYDVIAKVCKGHSTDFFKDSIDYFRENEATPFNRPVRGELLTSLLMIGDELDLHNKRVDFSEIAKFDLSGNSAVHWFKHQYVDFVGIKDGIVNITLKFPPNADEYKDLIKELIETKLKEQIEKVNPILSEFTSGLLHLNKINIKTKLDKTGNKRDLPEKALEELKKMLHKNKPEKFSTIEPEETISGNIPKVSKIFTGMEEELGRFKEALNQASLISIEGLGGIGKTEFAAKCIEEYLDVNKVVWFDCYADSKLDSLIENCGYIYVLKGESKTEKAKYSGFTDLIERDERIIFLDNFQDATDESFENFLAFSERRLSKAKIVLITREHPSLGSIRVCPVALKGLKKDALEYAKKVIDTYYPEVKTDESSLKNICSTVEGHPLAIDLAIQLLRYGKAPEDIIDEIVHLKEKGDDLSHRLLDEIFKHPNSTNEEKDLLLNFSVFRTKVEIEAFNYISDSEDRNLTLHSLIDKQMIYRDGNLYGTHPLVRKFCYHRLEDKGDLLVKELHVKAARYFKNTRREELNPALEEEIFYHLLNGEKIEELADLISEKGEEFIRLGHTNSLKEMMEKTVDHGVERAEFYLYCGDVAERRGEWNEALNYFDKAFNFPDVSDKTSAMAYMKYGEMLYRRGGVKESLDYFKDAYDLCKKIEDKKGEARSINDIGLVNETFGKLELAEKQIEEALNISRDINDNSGVATYLNNSGIIIRTKGDLDGALEKYKKSLLIREKTGDKAGIANSLNSIGYLLRIKGDLEIALEKHKKSLLIYEEIGNKEGIAISINNIGNILYLQEAYKRASEKYKKSLLIYEEIGNKEGIAIGLDNIGNILCEKSDFEGALEKHKKSLLIKEEIGNKAGIANSLNNIGLVLRKKGDSNGALEKFKKSLLIIEEMGDKEGIASSYHNIGTVYFEDKKDYRMALEKFFKAKTLQNQMRIKEKETVGFILNVRKTQGLQKFKTLAEEVFQNLPEDFKPFINIKDFTGDETVKEKEKVGRNDPCPCGSGKKYKKCCGS